MEAECGKERPGVNLSDIQSLTSKNRKKISKSNMKKMYLCGQINSCIDSIVQHFKFTHSCLQVWRCDLDSFHEKSNWSQQEEGHDRYDWEESDVVQRFLQKHILSHLLEKKKQNTNKIFFFYEEKELPWEKRNLKRQTNQWQIIYCSQILNMEKKLTAPLHTLCATNSLEVLDNNQEKNKLYLQNT